MTATKTGKTSNYVIQEELYKTVKILEEDRRANDALFINKLKDVYKNKNENENDNRIE